jgi:hypothetical protein
MPGSICLGPFLRGYRADGRGHGHPAYDPKALLGVLLYGYAIGVRSSRQIERRCHLRTSPSGCWPATRSRPRDHRALPCPHQQALAGFLVASLRLCAAAGLVRLGVVALDGTKVAAEAAERQRRYQQRVAELAAAARARGKQPRTHIKPRPRDEAPAPNAVANTTDPDSRFLRTRADGAEDMVHRVHFQQAKGSVLASHHQRGREEHHRDDQRLDY